MQMLNACQWARQDCRTAIKVIYDRLDIWPSTSSLLTFNISIPPFLPPTLLSISTTSLRMHLRKHTCQATAADTSSINYNVQKSTCSLSNTLQALDLSRDPYQTVSTGDNLQDV